MSLNDPETLKAWKPTDVFQPLHNSIPPELLPRFDPVYVEYYNKYNLGRLHTHEVPIEEYRKNPDRYNIAYGRAVGPDIYRISEQKCPVEGGEITVRIFEPEPVKNPDGSLKQRGAYINFHGGGWVFGDLTKDHDFCKRIVDALQGDLVAFDVDYRLAPEHRYPIPVNDCWAAFNWIRNEKAKEFNIDVSRLSVGGISAGGHLAAVIALLCRDNNIPLAFQSLVVPSCDLVDAFTPNGEFNREGCRYDSFREMEFTPALPMARMRFFHNHFLGVPRPTEYENDWRISPIRAPSHENLAPAYVFTAELDPLRDEGVAYAAKLKEAGNEVTHIQYPGVPHAFTHLDGILDAGMKYQKEVIAALKKYVGKSE